MLSKEELSFQKFVNLTDKTATEIFERQKIQTLNLITMIKSFDQTLLEIAYFQGETKNLLIPNGYGTLWSSDSLFIGDVLNGVRSSGFYFRPSINFVAHIEINDVAKKQFTGKIFYKETSKILSGRFDYSFKLVDSSAEISHVIDLWSYIGGVRQVNDNQDAFFHGNGILKYKGIDINAAFIDNIPIKITTITPNVLVETCGEKIHPLIQLICMKEVFSFCLIKENKNFIFTNQSVIHGIIDLGQQKMRLKHIRNRFRETVIITQHKNCVVRQMDKSDDKTAVSIYSDRFQLSGNYKPKEKKLVGQVYHKTGVFSACFLRFRPQGFITERLMYLDAQNVQNAAVFRPEDKRVTIFRDDYSYFMSHFERENFVSDVVANTYLIQQQFQLSLEQNSKQLAPKTEEQQLEDV